MATTPTTNYSWGKPTPDGSVGVWAQETNNLIDDIDSSIKIVEDSILSLLGDNKLVNPSFYIRQEDNSTMTGLSAGSSGQYIADMWQYHQDSLVGYSSKIELLNDLFYQSNSSNDTPYALRIQPHTVHSISAATSTANIALIYTKIEGHVAQEILANDCILSFSHKSNDSGPYGYFIFSEGATGVAYHDTFFNNLTGWQHDEYAIPFKTGDVVNASNNTSSATLIDAVNFNKDENASLVLGFVVAGGGAFGFSEKWTLYTTTANASIGTMDSRIGSVGDGGFMATTTNYISFSQIKLEIGSSSTKFIMRPFQDELKLCQRYYETSYNFHVAPGSSATTLGAIAGIGAGASITLAMSMFNVEKRTKPTISIYNPHSGSVSSMMGVHNSESSSVPDNFLAQTLSSTKMVGTLANKVTNEILYYGHYVADARM